ncbi:hypothetical protein ACFFMN_20195 [Planobispora siamensis]|uniref:Uncharacterized protein n=1 Tax=Planobispora siamensis TaxID=936338 RepID=A0A8J3WPV6_9ACTN|nr:hypothetical protein [Planobispora siamensis]GIH97355.1 hypothetical protein Psi01_79850 [Planobispora siamensis]
MTTTDGLRPGRAMISLLGSTFGTDDGTAKAFSVPGGRGRQAVLGGADRAGDEPRLLVDFNRGQPLLSARGQQVGERRGNTVRLWEQEYRVHRPRLRTRLRFAVTVGEYDVLQAREHSDPGSTVRTLRTAGDAALDPIVTLALILLVARPDKMGVLYELFRH